MRYLTQTLLLAGGLALLPNAQAENAATGEQLYTRLCGACHSVDHNRIGPKHDNTFGRKVGSEPDYAYSAALSASQLVWDAQLLDRWLSNPQATIPGQKMFFSVADPDSRRLIIEYLQSIAQTKN